MQIFKQQENVIVIENYNNKSEGEALMARERAGFL